MSKVRLAFQWVLRFFGLTPNNKDLYLEQIYILMYHLGFTYQDAYKCPVWQRFWFINRFKQELEQAKEANQNVHSKAQRNNSGSRVFRKAF